MPELRKDPIIGRWVIISTERAKRPSDLLVEKSRARGGFCPLCPGNEDKTPSEVFAFRDSNTFSNGPGWKLRVVPNKFPALVIEGELNHKEEGIYEKMRGIGAHEVIIETTDHDATASTLTSMDFKNILYSYRQRINELKKDGRFRYISIFKNYGKVAGASMEHPHSQVIALPVAPKRALEEMNGAEAYHGKHRSCVYCDIIKQELESRERVVFENEHFIAIEPFAARLPFETCLLPKKHISSFEATDSDMFGAMADGLSLVLKKINKALGFPPYNYILHSSVTDNSENPFYHWHFEIIPRLTKVAGFEWGTGFYINPTPPEQAARHLRETVVG